MKLSIEVEGYIQDIIAQILSWDKIKVFGKRIGVDTTDINTRDGKRSVVENILTKASSKDASIIISTLIDMSKKGTYDSDFSEKILSEINPILDRTMKCRVDVNGAITPIFSLLDEEPNLIVKELNRLGFNKARKCFDQATKTYKNSPKGSLSLLRSTMESLLEEILFSKGITPSSNYKDRLCQVSNLGILKILSTQECSRCHYKKKDHEFNYGYTLFALLSHYGSHAADVDEKLAHFLYTSTSAFLLLVIQRFDNLPQK